MSNLKIKLPSRYAIFNFKTKKFSYADLEEGIYEESSRIRVNSFEFLRGRLEEILNTNPICTVDNRRRPFYGSSLAKVEKYRNDLGIIEIEKWAVIDGNKNKRGYNYVIYNVRTNKFVGNYGDEENRIVNAPDCLKRTKEVLKRLLNGFPWGDEMRCFGYNKENYRIARIEQAPIFKPIKRKF